MQKQMTALACALLSVLLASCTNQPSPQNPVRAQRRAAPSPRAASALGQNFDYYLLNLSWSPEFCHSHPSDIQCAQHSTFVLHGLWPENNNGSYPANCSAAPGPSDASQYSDIYPDSGLLAHEWRTHGTCSGLTPDAFFQLARKALHSVAIPDTLANINRQISLPPARILGMFTEANPAIPATSLTLTCGNNYLTAVEVCLDKSLRPVACSGIRSCRANTVRIPPPQ
jgi:ribonuclease T2